MLANQPLQPIAVCWAAPAELFFRRQQNRHTLKHEDHRRLLSDHVQRRHRRWIAHPLLLLPALRHAFTYRHRPLRRYASYLGRSPLLRFLRPTQWHDPAWRQTTLREANPEHLLSCSLLDRVGRYPFCPRPFLAADHDLPFPPSGTHLLALGRYRPARRRWLCLGGPLPPRV